MNRRSLLASICGGIFLSACATGQSSAQAPGAAPMATVIASLTDAPRANAAGAPYEAYVVFIPTHAETRATPSLLAALGRIGAMGNAPALFVGDPATGAFDQSLTDAAIGEINHRADLGLDGSLGAILLVVNGVLNDPEGYSVFIANADDPDLIAGNVTRGLPSNPSAHWFPPPILAGFWPRPKP